MDSVFNTKKRTLQEILEAPAKEFDWFEALECCVREQPDIIQRQRLDFLSQEWTTCACGQECKRLPRRETGAPEDDELRCLGNEFYIFVSRGRFQKAIETLHAIEQRTAGLLAQL